MSRRPMKIHDLKSWPAPFTAIMFAGKRFEIRRDDRDYQPGDIVVIREFVPSDSADEETGEVFPGGFTGHSAGPFKIGYVERTPGCVPEGYCGFSLIQFVDPDSRCAA